MTNCHDDIVEFYKSKVRLSKEDKERLETARDTCKAAVTRGLEEKEDLKPEGFVEQGSFGMRTVVQHEDYDYDIDCGILFTKEKIVGSRGGDKTPRAARAMIASSFSDKRFKENPEIRRSCVRFNYQDGYHVDMPVYRKVSGLFGLTHYEIASGDEWRQSDPEAVTKWFNDAVKAKSPNMEIDGQMRRIVCLLKAIEKTRQSYNWPSGFVISVLVKDHYVSDERDDVSFVKTIRRIVATLRISEYIAHPVISGEQLAQAGNTKVCWMRDKLSEFDDKFRVLEGDCARGEAMKIWGQIFGTDWFSQRLIEKAASIGFGAGGTFNPSFTRPTDAGRWG